MNEARHPPLAQPPAHPTTQSPARIVAQILVDCVLRSHFADPLGDKSAKNAKNAAKALDFRPKRSVNCPEYRLQNPPHRGQTGRST